MKYIKVVLMLLSFVVIASCTSTKYKPNANAMDHFEKGKTTYQEVVGVLGKPNSTSIMSNGTKTLVYSDMNTQVDPATYIPFVGAFIGGASAEMKFLKFTFKSDILQDMQYTESSSHYSMSGN
jgi:hypothetical protein